MHLIDHQKLIAGWGARTFGKPDAQKIATRMNCEVAELLVALNHLPADGPEREEALKAIGSECADIQIMLVQVAAALGLNLEAETDSKMNINRSRKWGVTATGKVQHVTGKGGDPENNFSIALPLWRLVRKADDSLVPSPDVNTFIEPGSGLEMKMDKFYVLWDNGAALFTVGFPSAEAAQKEAHAAGYREAVIPTYQGWGEAWKGTDGINVFAASDLYLYWAEQNRDALSISPEQLA